MCQIGCSPDSGPDLFLARSPRTWLSSVIDAGGALQKDFAAQVGVSASQLSNHFARTRALNRSAEERVIAALDLCPLAASHYRLLVQWDRARSRRAWEEAEIAVLASRLKTRGARVGEHVARELPSLGALVVREITLVQGARAEPAWIGSRLTPPQPPAQVAAWIDLLLRLGLLSGSPAGKLRPCPSSAGFDPEIVRSAVAGLFHDARDLARQALNDVHHSGRHYSQVILGVPAGHVPELKAEVEALRCRIQARCDKALAEGDVARRVYVLLLEAFPLSRPVADDPFERKPFVPTPPGEIDERLPAGATDQPAPRIVHYRDYRRFLAARRIWAGQTFGELEQRLGHLIRDAPPTRSQVHAILSERAHIAQEHVDAWLSALTLPDADAACLRAQVLAQQATDPDEARERWREVDAWRQLAEARQLPDYCMDVLSSWISLATLELANSRAFVGDPAWIAAALRPQLREADVRENLELLVDLGLLERNGRGELVRAPGPGLVVPDSVRVAAVGDLFAQLCELGARALEVEPPEAREMGLLVAAVPESAWSDIVSDLELTRQRVQGHMDALIAGGASSPAEPLDQVFVWSTALFPATRPPGSESTRR